MSMATRMAKARTNRRARLKTPSTTPTSGAGRVWRIICITACVIAGLGLLAYVGEQMLEGVVSAVRSIVGAPEPVAGERMGWWGAPMVMLGILVGFEVLWALITLIFWRPKTKPDWEVPDSRLSREDLAERRKEEAEWRAENPSAARHPLLRGGTWVSMLGFTLMVGAPAFVDASLMANSPKSTYADGREGLLQIGKACPALAAETKAMIARGVPTTQDVVSMRVRAKVIAESPLPGQECRA
jgi:hypothetical protein